MSWTRISLLGYIVPRPSCTLGRSDASRGFSSHERTSFTSAMTAVPQSSVQSPPKNSQKNVNTSMIKRHQYSGVHTLADVCNCLSGCRHEIKRCKLVNLLFSPPPPGTFRPPSPSKVRGTVSWLFIISLSNASFLISGVCLLQGTGI